MHNESYGIREIEKDRIGIALSFAKGTGVYVVLKGVPTVIASPDGDAFINTTGNPGMATAGSGDVLTGIISSLAGQGINPLKASALGVYLHGLAGDEAAKIRGEHSLVASDIVDALPCAFSCLERG
jgi:NAD(P)H-hydrate epimerase